MAGYYSKKPVSWSECAASREIEIVSASATSDERKRRTALSSEPMNRQRLALVLWNGDVGGAEVLNVKLAQRLRILGADVTVVFVGTPWPLAERLTSADLPYRELDLGRGRNVLRHPRRYAAAIADAGGDGALLMERGFMASALRLGGYRGPIVAVEHGALLAEMQTRLTARRLLRELGRCTGAWADDSEVAVSDFMLGKMLSRPHAGMVRRIYNGVDQDVFRPLPQSRPANSPELVVGFAGRLVPGKGADRLIQAMARVHTRVPARLLIAGDGPERPRLISQAAELGVQSIVEFLGVVGDMPAFWQRCDVAAVPSDTWVESFSMVTLEAMSCGKAIVATHDGAIPELIGDGECGTLVAPGDVDALADAVIRYAEQPQLRAGHGSAARASAVERFDIEDCARSYLDLFAELSTRRDGKRKAP
jgi:glycosyltransferase involved in cell wall biosynthesis